MSLELGKEVLGSERRGLCLRGKETLKSGRNDDEPRYHKGCLSEDKVQSSRILLNAILMTDGWQKEEQQQNWRNLQKRRMLVDSNHL